MFSSISEGLFNEIKLLRKDLEETRLKLVEQCEIAKDLYLRKQTRAVGSRSNDVGLLNVEDSEVHQIRAPNDSVTPSENIKIKKTEVNALTGNIIESVQTDDTWPKPWLSQLNVRSQPFKFISHQPAAIPLRNLSEEANEGAKPPKLTPVGLLRTHSSTGDGLLPKLNPKPTTRPRLEQYQPKGEDSKNSTRKDNGIHTLISTLPRLEPFDSQKSNSNAGSYLFKFEEYSSLNNLTDYDKSRIFGSFLSVNEASWLMTIDTETRSDWNKLKSAFLSQYDVRKIGLVNSIELLKARMKPNQSVNNYVKELTELWSTTHCDDHKKLEIFVNGLLPYLQASTISTSQKTFLDAKAAACLYESLRGDIKKIPVNRMKDGDVQEIKLRLDRMESDTANKHVYAMKHTENNRDVEYINSYNDPIESERTLNHTQHTNQDRIQRNNRPFDADSRHTDYYASNDIHNNDLNDRYDYNQRTINRRKCAYCLKTNHTIENCYQRLENRCSFL